MVLLLLKNQNRGSKYKKVTVSYIDTNSNNVITIDSKYNPSVNSTVQMASINQALIPGSSGSPVLDNKGNVVGMISCLGDEYQNMTLVVPIETINTVIDKSVSLKIDGISEINIDTETKLYPKGFNCPLNSGYLNLLPNGVDIKYGELVIQSYDPNLKPFDIISLKDKNRLANFALENNSGTLELSSATVLSATWRNIYGALPRGDFKGNGEIDILDLNSFKQKTYNLKNEIRKKELEVEIKNSDGLERDILINKLNKVEIEIQKNPYAEIEIQKNPYAEIDDSKQIIKILDYQLIDCLPGQSIKIEYNNSKIYFATIKKIIQDNNIIEIELTESIPKYVLDDISKIILFERHSAYWNQINEDLTGGTLEFNVSTPLSSLDLRNSKDYKKLVQSLYLDIGVSLFFLILDL